MSPTVQPIGWNRRGTATAGSEILDLPREAPKLHKAPSSGFSKCRAQYAMNRPLPFPNKSKHRLSTRRLFELAGEEPRAHAFDRGKVGSCRQRE